MHDSGLLGDHGWGGDWRWTSGDGGGRRIGRSWSWGSDGSDISNGRELWVLRVLSDSGRGEGDAGDRLVDPRRGQDGFRVDSWWRGDVPSGGPGDGGGAGGAWERVRQLGDRGGFWWRDVAGVESGDRPGDGGDHWEGSSDDSGGWSGDSDCDVVQVGWKGSSD